MDMMIPELVDVRVAAVAVVVIGIVVRVYYGSAVFHPRWVTAWNVVRRVAAPLLQQAVYRFAPFNVQIEKESEANEYAATVDLDPKPLALTIDEVREVEVPLLNGFKTAPDGRTERATFVWYLGPRPGGLPRWLRKYQIDVTVFKREDGRYDLYAHHEANSYRPDLWADHLFQGPSFSIPKGVARTQNALEDADIPYTEEQEAGA